MGIGMIELLFFLAFLAASAWVAARAFMNPKGVYQRSVIGFLLGALAAVGIWWLASPLISSEAGLGAFVLFCAVVGLCGFVAILACIAASVRHILE
jgi:hypothetical protein